jgi:hypothetical protein
LIKANILLRIKTQTYVSGPFTAAFTVTYFRIYARYVSLCMKGRSAGRQYLGHLGLAKDAPASIGSGWVLHFIPGETAHDNSDRDQTPVANAYVVRFPGNCFDGHSGRT